MISKKLWHVRSKWSRHLGLAGHSGIAKHIPVTKIMNRDDLKKFLNKHRVAFIKPVHGSQGNNIIKVRRLKKNYYVQYEERVHKIPSRKFVGKIFGQVGRRHYLIQKGIPLVKIKGRPVDFRVLLLKPRNRWEVMGVIGKIATGNRIVTNFSHGGKPYQFKPLLRLAGWNEKEIENTKALMYRLCLAAAYEFNRRYKHCRRLGVDLALDNKRGIWIIEVNTNPFYEMFRQHEDINIYNKISRYMKIIRRNQSNL